MSFRSACIVHCHCPLSTVHCPLSTVHCPLKKLSIKEKVVLLARQKTHITTHMAIYRFRATFEDYEEIYREVDMPARSTFLELHEAIQQSLGYRPDVPSSFYVSNDQWKKGVEIAFLPTESKVASGVLRMEDIRMSKFIYDPHQKFYYVYDFERPYDFHVELVKIAKEVDGKTYPSLFRSVGEAPKSASLADYFPLTEDGEEDYGPDEAPADETEYGVDEDDLSGIGGPEDGEETTEKEDANNYE